MCIKHTFWDLKQVCVLAFSVIAPEVMKNKVAQVSINKIIL